LARLQDDVVPFPFAQVEEIVTVELGVRLSKAFRYATRSQYSAMCARAFRPEHRSGMTAFDA
jgi:hypothetical protein